MNGLVFSRINFRNKMKLVYLPVHRNTNACNIKYNLTTSTWKVTSHYKSVKTHMTCQRITQPGTRDVIPTTELFAFSLIALLPVTAPCDAIGQLVPQGCLTVTYTRACDWAKLTVACPTTQPQRRVCLVKSQCHLKHVRTNYHGLHDQPKVRICSQSANIDGVERVLKCIRERIQALCVPRIPGICLQGKGSKMQEHGTK